MKMHKIWLVLSMLPIAAYCQLSDRQIVLITKSDDVMYLVVNEDPFVEENLPSLFQSLGFEDDQDMGHCVLEIEEDDDSLLPWSNEPLARDEMPHFIEKKTHEMIKEIDDPYGYEFLERDARKKNHPSLERVQKEGQNLAADPIEPKTHKAMEAPAVKSTPLAAQPTSDQDFAQYLKEEEKLVEKAVPTFKKRTQKRSSAQFVKRK